MSFAITGHCSQTSKKEVQTRNPNSMRSSVILVFVTATCLFGSADKVRGDSFSPPAGHCLLIIGQDKDSTDEYTKAVGLPLGGTMMYTSIQELKGMTTATEYGAGVQDFSYLAERYPDAVLQIGLYMVGALNDVAAGKYDSNIDRLGDWIRKTKRPVYLRVGYEFDYPENNYEPREYIRAFRHVRDRLEKHQVSNVAYVWHSYAGPNSGNSAQWYPGDDYVDWVAVSWFDPKQPHLETIARLAKRLGKPLMIAEATARRIGTKQGSRTWNQWFRPCLEYMKRHDVRVLCYINWEWDSFQMFRGQGWGDCRIQANRIVQAEWLKEFSSTRYLQPSAQLFSTLGYKSRETSRN